MSPQVNWTTEVSTVFAPNSSSCNWLLPLELWKTQPQHLMHTEKMSMYSQKREQTYDLRAWLTSNTKALCCGALEKSAGEIPDCFLSKEKLRISVFGGLQPTPTSAKNTIFSEMPNMLVTKTFLLYFHNQNTQWAVAKLFLRAFCFRLTGWFE